MYAAVLKLHAYMPKTLQGITIDNAFDQKGVSIVLSHVLFAQAGRPLSSSCCAQIGKGPAFCSELQQYVSQVRLAALRCKRVLHSCQAVAAAQKCCLHVAGVLSLQTSDQHRVMCTSSCVTLCCVWDAGASTRSRHPGLSTPKQAHTPCPGLPPCPLPSHQRCPNPLPTSHRPPRHSQQAHG